MLRLPDGGGPRPLAHLKMFAIAAGFGLAAYAVVRALTELARLAGLGG